MLHFFRKNITVLPDDELVLRYQQQGEMEVLGVLYERYVELVFGVCLKFFKEKPKAEDAVMAIFEILVEKVKTQEIRQFRPWLHVVAKNYCLMQLRKKEYTVPIDGMSPSVQADLVQSAGDLHPVDEFELDGQQAALKKCVEGLPPHQKHCVEQFYFEDKSYKDIADKTGEALGMVRSHIQNGRRNLRICMEKSGARAV